MIIVSVCSSRSALTASLLRDRVSRWGQSWRSGRRQRKGRLAARVSILNRCAAILPLVCTKLRSAGACRATCSDTIAVQFVDLRDHPG